MDHKRNQLCFLGYANLVKIKAGPMYKGCPQCLLLAPKGGWENHIGSKKHKWRQPEVKEGISWGFLAEECFRFDWRDSMEPNTWWLYEFATVLQGLNLDRSRLLGIH